MTPTQQAVELAIEGGWSHPSTSIRSSNHKPQIIWHK